MADDIIAAWGHLLLGSRLKRLGERLQGDVSRLFAAHGLNVQPSQAPLLLALEQHETATVGALATMLGISQPGITRNLKKLVEEGLVEEVAAPGDQRQRTLRLTQSGRDAMAMAHRDLFPRVTEEVQAMCASQAGDLLEQIAGLEAGLTRISLDERVKMPR